MYKTHSFSFVLVCSVVLPILSHAAIPTNYYASADGKKGEALRSQLQTIISSNYNSISYSGLEPYYEQTDFRADGTLWDMYSTCIFTMEDANKPQKKVCDGWNKEHAVPQSWFAKVTPMKSDLFHVYPTDARVNNFRGNYPYGETSVTANVDNDSHALGHVGASNFGGYTGKVYEPDDEYKGDFARTYFYMATRYMDKDFTKNNEGQVMFTNGADLTPYAVSLLLKWHRQDPVSQKEIDRNNAVYGIQRNRNPFIDYPYLVEFIWGDKTSSAVHFSADLISSEDDRFVVGVSDGSMVVTDPMLFCNSSSLAFEPVMTGQSSTATLSFIGVNLSQGISISIGGADAQYFSVTPMYIAQGNGSHSLTLTYTPAATGVHNAVLTVESDGAESITIPLAGSCASQCAVTWRVDGQAYTVGAPTTVVAVGNYITTIPDAPQSCSDESELFVGWSAEAIDGTTDEEPADLFTDADDAPRILSDMTFHAVFAHLETSGKATSDTLRWISGSTNTGWLSTAKVNNAYSILITNALIQSPAVDLSAIQKIVITCRTYGGTQYNNITITADGQTIGTLSAVNKNMAEQVWTPTTTLSGQAALTFSSTTNTSLNGPGIESIEIITNGMQYTYSRFMTTCTQLPSGCTQPLQQPALRCRKVLIDGHIMIDIDGKTMDILGRTYE